MLIVPRDPAESTDFFRFQVLKTADPRDLYERALTYLQADYFQRPAEFGDVLTAVLPPNSELAAATHSRRAMRARVRRSSRNAIGCPARHLRPKPAKRSREATLWHNRLFNPSLPDDVLVLGFRPDWKSAEA